MPNSQKNKLDIATRYQQHQLRLNGIDTSKRVLDLILEIQRHRAASLATLGGDLFFEKRLWSIQKAVTQHLTILEQQSQGLISHQEWRQLYGEWVTIRRQWQKDSVMQNFLLHSHLIDFILKLNSGLCERSGHRLLDSEHQALADYSMRHLPLLMETAAQARGLATHCAAQQSNPKPLASRIRYLIAEIKSMDSQALSALVDSRTEHYQVIQRANKAYRRLHFRDIFLMQLSTHFTDTAQAGLRPDEIYTNGSQFIMATYDVLMQAYELMGKSIDDEIQAWIDRSSYQS